MRIDVVSIFPEYLAPLELSLIGKARQDGLLDLRVHDLRDFTTDRHRSVDDTPYGGGAGMVMKPEPWAQALAAVAGAVEADHSEEALEGASAKPVLIVPSPAGERFNQALAYELAEEDQLVFACGRYEGIDERVIEWAEEHFTVRPMSLGDYVLNGGEVAVLAMVEAIGRLLPGVVGNPDSLVEESHSDGLLEYPVYTKPSSWRDREVPAVLLSGNHGKIAQWRRHEQYRRTAERRPDLLETFDAGKLPRADRTAFADLGYDVVDGHLRVRRDAGSNNAAASDGSGTGASA
ncbi:MAG TPA: tRNA (guanosine(37)-N1)-methyltransferase TrmD [Arthrobacter sp.]|jgi:tRNA (guanine37-N1)-methyltransferase